MLSFFFGCYYFASQSQQAGTIGMHLVRSRMRANNGSKKESQQADYYYFWDALSNTMMFPSIYYLNTNLIRKNMVPSIVYCHLSKLNCEFLPSTINTPR